MYAPIRRTLAERYRRGFAVGGFYTLIAVKRRLPVEYHRMLDHLAVHYLKGDNVVTLGGVVQ